LKTDGTGIKKSIWSNTRSDTQTGDPIRPVQKTLTRRHVTRRPSSNSARTHTHAHTRAFNPALERMEMLACVIGLNVRGHATDEIHWHPAYCCDVGKQNVVFHDSSCWASWVQEAVGGPAVTCLTVLCEVIGSNHNVMGIRVFIVITTMRYTAFGTGCSSRLHTAAPTGRLSRLLYANKTD